MRQIAPSSGARGRGGRAGHLWACTQLTSQKLQLAPAWLPWSGGWLRNGNPPSHAPVGRERVRQRTQCGAGACERLVRWRWSGYVPVRCAMFGARAATLHCATSWRRRRKSAHRRERCRGCCGRGRRDQFRDGIPRQPVRCGRAHGRRRDSPEAVSHGRDCAQLGMSSQSRQDAMTYLLQSGDRSLVRGSGRDYAWESEADRSKRCIAMFPSRVLRLSIPA